MSKQKGKVRTPRGLTRMMYRVPILFYRFNLGWIFGECFMLLNRIGRVSGLTRQAVLG